MHIQTHVMSGWCVADLLDLTPRERLFAMLAASAADFDGLGILISGDYYTAWHHVLGHNLLFGTVLASVLAVFSTHGVKAFGLYLALFHLHLMLDYYGSGPGWGIFYFWPFSDREIQNPQAWAFFSWQNLCAAGVFLLWVIAIIFKSGRTPLELLMPSLDRKIVRFFNRNA
jgi:inner membrane protein